LVVVVVGSGLVSTTRAHYQAEAFTPKVEQAFNFFPEHQKSSEAHTEHHHAFTFLKHTEPRASVHLVRHGARHQQ